MTSRTGGSLAFVSNQQIASVSPPHNHARTSGEHSGFPQQPVTAEQVLKSFNTRAFRREQPDRRDVMLSVISRAIAAQEPCPS